MQVKLQKTTNFKAKPLDGDKLGFGRIFTDHMLIIDYTEGIGWHDARIVPYGPLSLDPAATVLHYGQAIFEGLKAYNCPDGKIRMFRPDANMARINVSNDRLCIPPIDAEAFGDALTQLIRLEKDWIPKMPGTSLYIRPFIISTDVFLGVHPALTYKFIVILSPSGAYYPEGLDPVRIYVENEYVRAVRGGIGFAKTPGNYAASLKAQREAGEKGFTQVLWLDGVEKKYVEEVGTMNVFFKINGEVVTPALNGSILAGITRDSVITLLKDDMGVTVTERKISIGEIYEAAQNNTLEEAFGTGTAAVISPIGELSLDGETVKIAGGKIGALSQKLYDTLTGIQIGRLEDRHGWSKIVAL